MSFRLAVNLGWLIAPRALDLTDRVRVGRPACSPRCEMGSAPWWIDHPLCELDAHIGRECLAVLNMYRATPVYGVLSLQPSQALHLPCCWSSEDHRDHVVDYSSLLCIVQRFQD